MFPDPDFEKVVEVARDEVTIQDEPELDDGPARRLRSFPGVERSRTTPERIASAPRSTLSGATNRPDPPMKRRETVVRPSVTRRPGTDADLFREIRIRQPGHRLAGAGRILQINAVSGSS